MDRHRSSGRQHEVHISLHLWSCGRTCDYRRVKRVLASAGEPAAGLLQVNDRSARAFVTPRTSTRAQAKAVADIIHVCEQGALYSFRYSTRSYRYRLCEAEQMYRKRISRRLKASAVCHRSSNIECLLQALASSKDVMKRERIRPEFALAPCCDRLSKLVSH